MKINKKALEKGLTKNARAQAFFAVKEEMDVYLPVTNFYEMVKSKETPLLTVAALVSYKVAIGELNEEQVKAFIKISIQNPEQVTGFWASLPSVIQFLNEQEEYEETGIRPPHKKLWYGESLQAFPQERDAIIFLLSVMDEEDMDVLSDIVLQENIRFQERKDAQKAQLQKISEAFK